MWHQMARNSALRQHFISYGLPLNDRWQPRKAKNKQTLQSLEHSAPSRQKQVIGVQLLVVIRASSSVVAAFLSALTCTIQTLNSEHRHLGPHHHQLDHHHHQLGHHCKPGATETRSSTACHVGPLALKRLIHFASIIWVYPFKHILTHLKQF